MYSSNYNIIIKLNKTDQWKYVLFNSLSGNVNYLNEDYYQYIQELQDQCTQTKSDPIKDERLSRRGYLYKDKNEEELSIRQIISNISKSIAEKKQNFYIVIPQNACFLGCSYCQYKNLLNERGLNEIDLERILNFIEDNEKNSDVKQKPVLIIYGGETLSSRDKLFALIKKILENYVDHFFHIVFYTYGFNLGLYKDIILNADIKKLTFVFKLLENEDNVEGQEILSSGNEACLDLLRGHGIHSLLSLKITENNVDRMVDYVNYFIGKGIVYSQNCEVQFIPTVRMNCRIYNPCSIDYGLYEKVFKFYGEFPQLESVNFSRYGILGILFNLIKSRGRFYPRMHYCQANGNLLIFDPDGNMFTCYGGLHTPNLAVGNIHHPEKIDKIKLGQWRERNVEALEECHNCPAKYVCGGGCSFEALKKKGSIFRSNCQPYRDLIKWAFEGLYEDFLESEKYKSYEESEETPQSREDNNVS